MFKVEPPSPLRLTPSGQINWAFYLWSLTWILLAGLWITLAPGRAAPPLLNISWRRATRWSSSTERSLCSRTLGTSTPTSWCRTCPSLRVGTSWFQVTWFTEIEKWENRIILKLLSGDYGRLSSVIEKRKKYSSCFLQIKFTSLSSYLWLLKLSSELLSEHSQKSNMPCLLYLAAAVSDFYVPASQLPVHKIQSSQVYQISTLHCIAMYLTLHLY